MKMLYIRSVVFTIFAMFACSEAMHIPTVMLNDSRILYHLLNQPIEKDNKPSLEGTDLLEIVLQQGYITIQQAEAIYTVAISDDLKEKLEQEKNASSKPHSDQLNTQLQQLYQRTTPLQGVSHINILLIGGKACVQPVGAL